MENYLVQMAEVDDFLFTEQEINDYVSLCGAPYLDKQYNVFGEVMSGLDVLDKIAASKKGTLTAQ